MHSVTVFFNRYINPLYPYAGWEEEEVRNAEAVIQNLSRGFFEEMQDLPKAEIISDGLKTSEKLGKNYTFSLARPSTWRNVFRAVAHLFGFSLYNTIRKQIANCIENWKSPQELIIALEGLREEKCIKGEDISVIDHVLPHVRLKLTGMNREELEELAEFAGEERLKLYFDTPACKETLVQRAWRGGNISLLVSFFQSNPDLILQKCFLEPSKNDEKQKTLIYQILLEEKRKGSQHFPSSLEIPYFKNEIYLNQIFGLQAEKLKEAFQNLSSEPTKKILFGCKGLLSVGTREQVQKALVQADWERENSENLEFYFSQDPLTVLQVLLFDQNAAQAEHLRPFLENVLANPAYEETLKSKLASNPELGKKLFIKGQKLFPDNNPFQLVQKALVQADWERENNENLEFYFSQDPLTVLQVLLFEQEEVQKERVLSFLGQVLANDEYKKTLKSKLALNPVLARPLFIKGAELFPDNNPFQCLVSLNLGSRGEEEKEQQVEESCSSSDSEASPYDSSEEIP